MPSWFSKVFKNGEAQSDPAQPLPEPAGRAPEPWTAAAVPPARPNPILDDEDYAADLARQQRRVVHPPVITEETDGAPAPADGLRIKAQVQRDGISCLFMLDRPLFEGHSLWAPGPEYAGDSPLAEALFAIEGVESVLIHHVNLTVTRSPLADAPWPELARRIGAAVRAHLEAGTPVINPEFIERLPTEDEIRERLLAVLNYEINPGIAAHSGVITLERVEGNTVYISMGGGCQGCAASTITLKQGIHAAFRDAAPQVGAILDVTDHAAGTNPFYKSLPAGMRADG